MEKVSQSSSNVKEKCNEGNEIAKASQNLLSQFSLHKQRLKLSDSNLNHKGLMSIHAATASR